MKDYYYFLGIPEDAAVGEIKNAYRKLSLKYHPDKNPGDAFFATRFREIQEAYDILSDAEKRRIYDENLTHQQRSYRPALPPSIKNFSVSKTRVKKGDAVTVFWQTVNADVVKVMPFGLEKGYGERTFRINDFKEGKFQLLLHATNSLLNKTLVRGLTICEIFESEEDTAQVSHLKPKTQSFQKPRPNVSGSLYRKGLAILFLIVFLLFLYRIFTS